MSRIRIHLATPLAFWGMKPPKPLHLDGILAYCQARLEGYKKHPGEINNLKEFELPLAKEEFDGGCYYRASAMFLPEEAQLWSWTKVRSTDWAEAMTKLVGRIGRYKERMQSGGYKGAMEPYWLVVTPYVDFYFEVTDRAHFGKLVQMLWDMGYLGSNRGTGFGLIADIKLQKDSPDWAVWKDGKPTRSVPVKAAGEKPLPREYAGYRPPYWYNGYYDWCYVPPREQWWPQIKTEREKLAELLSL